MFYVQWLLYGSESRSIMYTFIYMDLHTHWYEDVTIHHQRTSKNTINTTESPLHSSPHPITFSRAPPIPSPPACCGSVLPANQYDVFVSFRRELFSRWSYPQTITRPCGVWPRPSGKNSVKTPWSGSMDYHQYFSV